MSLKDDEQFRRKLETVSNNYYEIKKVMNAARKMSNRYDNKILHSEAITHVIHETEPDRYYIENFRDEYESHFIKDMFCYIDDKEICNAVYDSFYESKKKKRINFLYNKIENTDRQARVRVLTRMLWYKL